MKNFTPRDIPGRVYLRYTLLQLPEIIILSILLYGVNHFFPLGKYIWLVLLLWIIKDIFLFPFLWRSYDTGAGDTSQFMINKTGRAEGRLDPSGYIKANGELWKAHQDDPEESIEKGDRVLITKAEGLTLRVKKIKNK
jgi:membrane-bound ClpP family serine protease